jgi:hypothetical protein
MQGAKLLANKGWHSKVMSWFRTFLSNVVIKYGA